MKTPVWGLSKGYRTKKRIVEKLTKSKPPVSTRCQSVSFAAVMPEIIFSPGFGWLHDLLFEA
jgi:hypothetical protein